METITQLALKWRKYWVRREDWRKAVATRDPELAIEIAAKALKNAAELGLSMLTFITYNVETGQTTVVKQVIRSLLERCFPEKKDYERALAKLVKESKIRTTMSYERNDPGMPWILYAIRDGNYYFEQKDGNWSQISREHLKTLAWQHGIDTEGAGTGQSQFDSYLWWLGFHRAVGDIWEVHADYTTDDCATEEKLPMPPVIVEGMLHGASKIELGGGSKSFKTWALIDLAVSVATGTTWWGRKCLRGKVLYVNFELAKAFFQQRRDEVLQAKRVKLEPGQLFHMCLRGQASSVEALMPVIIRRARELGCALVILDPVYKLLLGAGRERKDENSASDITRLMNEMERLAVETGAAVGFGAHFSKGNQASKESMDRISGSGVFARDPDSVLTMTAHSEDGVFSVEGRLRNLPPLEPFCVRWHYPLFELAEDCDPKDLKQPQKKNGYQDSDWLQHLGEKPTSYKDWSERVIGATGMVPSTFKSGRARLVKEKKVTQVGSGYVLTELGRRSVRPSTLKNDLQAIDNQR